MANLSPKHFLALCSLLLALCHLQRFKWFRRSTNIAYRSPATILDLPLEIRLRVFAFVFAGKKLAVRSSSRIPATRYSLELEPQIYNVALTCRQFYEEIQQGGFEYCVWHFQSFGALNQLAKYPTKILHPRQLKRVVVTGFRGLDWQVLNQLPNLTVLVLNVERAREIYWDTPHVIYHYADDGVLRTVKEWFIKDWDLVTGGELDVAAQDVLRLYRMKQRKFSISLLFYVEGLPEINANRFLINIDTGTVMRDYYPFAFASEFLGQGRRLGVFCPADETGLVLSGEERVRYLEYTYKLQVV